MDGDGLVGFATRTVAVVREKNVTVTAASIAYYAFNSLVPLALLLFVLLTTYGKVDALIPLFRLFTGTDPSQFESLVRQVGGQSSGRLRAAALAFGICLWSSLRLFSGIDSVFSEVYGTRKELTTVRRVVNSVLMLVMVAVGVAGIVAVGVFVSFRVTDVLWTVATPFLLWGSLVVLFVPMYYRFPGEVSSLREAMPGAALASFGWTASLLVLRAYVGVSQSVRLYGIAGGLLLVLTWLYVGSLVLLLGVVANAVLADRVDADADWYPGGDAAEDAGGSSTGSET